MLRKIHWHSFTIALLYNFSSIHMQLNIHYARDAHILRRSRNHFTIPRSSWVKRSNLRTGDPKILGVTVQNLLSRTTWRPICATLHGTWIRVSVNRLIPEHHMAVCSTYTVIVTCIRRFSATELVLAFPSLFVVRSIQDPTFFFHFHCDIQQVCESLLICYCNIWIN
jgi:hypothetical protein